MEFVERLGETSVVTVSVVHPGDLKPPMDPIVCPSDLTLFYSGWNLIMCNIPTGLAVHLLEVPLPSHSVLCLWRTLNSIDLFCFWSDALTLIPPFNFQCASLDCLRRTEGPASPSKADQLPPVQTWGSGVTSTISSHSCLMAIHERLCLDLDHCTHCCGGPNERPSRNRHQSPITTSQCMRNQKDKVTPVYDNHIYSHRCGATEMSSEGHHGGGLDQEPDFDGESLGASWFQHRRLHNGTTRSAYICMLACFLCLGTAQANILTSLNTSLDEISSNHQLVVVPFSNKDLLPTPSSNLVGDYQTNDIPTWPIYASSQHKDDFYFSKSEESSLEWQIPSSISSFINADIETVTLAENLEMTVGAIDSYSVYALTPSTRFDSHQVSSVYDSNLPADPSFVSPMIQTYDSQALQSPTSTAPDPLSSLVEIPSLTPTVELEITANQSDSDQLKFVNSSTLDRGEKPNPPPTSRSDVILVAITAGVLCLVGGALVLLFFRHYRHKCFPRGTRSPQSWLNLESFQDYESSVRSKGLTRPVHAKNFPAWVQRSCVDSDFRFGEEFESLSDVGRELPTAVARLPFNRDKNRYGNVTPYDHSRVRLDTVHGETTEGTDFINANYIQGFNRPNAYIATQGPLIHTAGDFWRMVVEHNCQVVLMVAQCIEKGKEKCFQYWPTTGTCSYGDMVQVRLVEESIQSAWTERLLEVQCRGSEPKIVHQLHFSAWPDHGTPRNIDDVIEFLMMAHQYFETSDAPILVHCSAGVGRTGTVICLSISIQRLQEEDIVDVYGTVASLRLQRCLMVESEDQYVFIHRALLEYLKRREAEAKILRGYSLVPLEEASTLSRGCAVQTTQLLPSAEV